MVKTSDFDSEIVGSNPTSSVSADRNRSAFSFSFFYGVMPMIENNVTNNVTSEKRYEHPTYYARGKIETWDFIADKGLDFDLGNAVKYIVRAGYKHEDGVEDVDKAIEDLEKCVQYVQHKIRILRSNSGQKTPVITGKNFENKEETDRYIPSWYRCERPTDTSVQR